MAPPFAIEILILVFGLCIGSFLNVCIYRLPESKSIVFPGSMCPQCGHPIQWYDNLPVIGYLLLRGRCRHCKSHIPFRYVWVEILTGLSAVCIYLQYGLTIECLVYFAFISSLIIVIFIDIDHQIIPNVITLPGIPIFFLASLAIPEIRPFDSLLGIVSGGGSLYLVAWTYHLITGREGMGMGDVKLLAMIGALVTWKGVIFTIYMSSAVGTIIGVCSILHERHKDFKTPIPYGPFLSMGAIAYLFFGQQIIDLYFKMVG
jgi:leader peptidase (prepilin peptidase) / N-methyltransferase